MSKTVIAVLAALVVVGGAIYFLQEPIGMYMTKRHSPFQEVELQNNGLDVIIDYCRPYMKGREIFGGLVPYGEVWRTGANEATTFTVNEDVMFGGKKLAAGTYGLFTIPEPDSWTIILNSVAEQWGAFDYDPTRDVLRVEAKTEPVEQPLEQLTITLGATDSGMELVFAWDSTAVRVPISPAQ
jgi:hypothetical protein